MKIFYTLCVFLFAAGAFAQPYIPMLEEDHIWNIDSNGSTLNPVTVSGSTIINGKDYKSVFIGTYETDCLLREEEGVVYKYDSYSDVEYAYFDFSLEVGDVYDVNEYSTSCFGPGSYLNLAYVIRSEIQEIAGAQRKVIEFSSQPNGTFPDETWIEGIGSLSGLDNFGQNFDNDVDLRCFFKDGETYYFNDAVVCYQNIGYEDYIKEQIILSPSPVTTFSKLYLPPEAAIDALKIFDVHGRLLLDEQITSDYYTFDSALFESGLYFYQVSSASEVIKTAQFIVE